MKRIASVVLAFVFLLSAKVCGQTISPEQRQQIIATLDSADILKKGNAIRDIIKYNICEAVPKIEQKIWIQDNTLKYSFLNALLHCNSPNVGSIAHALIDSADIYRLDKFGMPDYLDPLRMRSRVTYFLMKLGDYSTVEYMFANVERDSSRVDLRTIDMLEVAARNLPRYAERAKAELIRLMHTASLDIYRYDAMTSLVRLYGIAISPELVRVCIEDTPGGSNSIGALHNLIRIGYPEIHSFLIERLSTEPQWAYRSEIADTLLKRYGTPADYKAVLEYVQWETNSTARNLTSLALARFTPPIPVPSLAVVTMLDSVVSYKHQASHFGWLADANFVSELDADLQSARTHLLSGDSVNCARRVKAFQQKIDEEYKDSLDDDNRTVTVEGWKFLYYNAQYILDRLPQIPPVQEHILSVPSQYATIQAAVNASHPGDVIEVSPGTYSELVSINSKDSLTLRTTGGIDQVTVRGFHFQQSNVITIKGFIVDATGTTEHGIELLGGNNQNTDVTIEACEIKNAGNDQSGILIARGNPRTRIVNNRIHDNGRNGILIIDATGGPHYVINNTIVRNGWNGVDVARQHVIYLVNNILSFNGTKSGSTGGRYGASREAMTGPGEASGITLLNNLIVGNNGSISSTSSKDLGNYAQTLDATDSGNYTTLGTEGMGVTPAPELAITDVFVSATDLHLKSGSFAINRGLSTYSPPDAKAGAIPGFDFEGEGRPKGAAVDGGADERE